VAVALDAVGFGKSVFRDVRTELAKWSKSKKNQQGIVIFVGFIVVLGVMFSYQAGAIKLGAQAAAASSGGGNGKAVTFGSGWTLTNGTAVAQGTVQENSDTGTQTIQATDLNIASVTVTLSWNDEPDMQKFGRTYINGPDELGIKVVSPWDQVQNGSALNVYETTGGPGEVSFTFNVTQKKYNGDNGTGDWNYTVSAGNCGDFFTKHGPIGFKDTSNAYTVTFDWNYYVKAKK
jgi:hypothetical protein